MLILHVVGGSEDGIISSQVFGHLRSFKGWIQTEACVIPSYHGMLKKYFFHTFYLIKLIYFHNKRNSKQLE